MSHFLVSAVVFHASLSALCIEAFLWWRRGDASSPSIQSVRAATLMVTLVAAMPPLAAVATFLGARSGFTVIRLVSQGLFAELLGLCAVLGVTDRRGGRPLSWQWGVACVALLGTYWQGYHREPEDLHVRRHVVDLSGGTGRHTLRILHLSDIQTYRVGEYEERVLRLAGDLEPDLVVWTGDYVQPRLRADRERTESRLRALLRARAISARYGSYAVRGDVDHHWPSPVAGTGIVPLSGSSARIALDGGSSLALIGLNSGTSRGRDVAALCRELATARAADIRIAFGHNPSFAGRLARCGGVDLALAGHTHGGQVVLPLVGALITKSALPRRYVSGLLDYEGLPLHVSAGIGMERGTAPQVRFGCPPEICLLEVRYRGRGDVPSRAAAAGALPRPSSRSGVTE